MSVISFYVLLAFSVALFIFGLRTKSGYLSYPTLVSAVFVGWVVPQLWSLLNTTDEIRSQYLFVLNVFALACLLAVYLGWRAASFVRRDYVLPKACGLSLKTLKATTIVGTAFTWVMWLILGEIDIDVADQGGWTGRSTIVYLFLNLKTIPLFLSILLFLVRRTPLTTILLILNLAIYAPLIFVYFRRRAMFELFMSLSLGLWFARGYAIPRTMVLPLVVIFSLVIFGTGELRKLAMGSTLSEWSMPTITEIASIDFWALTPFVREAATPELDNALSLVELSSKYGDTTYGATSWNRLVFQWVPAQLVGQDVKEALMFDLGTANRMFYLTYHDIRPGSAPTAIGEAYLEFGMLGWVFFFLTAYVMGLWWQKASKGNRYAQICYAIGIVPAVIMPTAYASYFFVMMILYLWGIVIFVFGGRLLRGLITDRKIYPN